MGDVWRRFLSLCPLHGVNCLLLYFDWNKWICALHDSYNLIESSILLIDVEYSSFVLLLKCVALFRETTKGYLRMWRNYI